MGLGEGRGYCKRTFSELMKRKNNLSSWDQALARGSNGGVSRNGEGMMRCSWSQRAQERLHIVAGGMHLEVVIVEAVVDKVFEHLHGGA